MESHLTQPRLATAGASEMPLAQAADLVRRLIDNVSQAFLGKEETVKKAVLALMCGGHVLVEDVPGLGKTLLAKAIAQSLSADFKRIQFTADLLPSDVTGVTVFSPETQAFAFRRGPIFANVLLGDEINRATPRTQSSLLEAMEEHCVTVDGVAYPLPSPFQVIATQNPIELEGTYPLPFAQMDRFMLRLDIGYLDKAHEIQMLRDHRQSNPLDKVTALLDCPTVDRIQAAVRRINLAEPLLAYLVDIVQTTRQTDSLEYGASPRGSLDTQTYSQALALAAGRDYVLPDDIKQAARLVLPHRLIAKKGTRSVTVNGGSLITHLLETVPVPV